MSIQKISNFEIIKFIQFKLFFFFLIEISLESNNINYTMIEFSSKSYKAGHFAFNSNGDMIIEYSSDHNRLFYGLKNNGKPYFKNDEGNEIYSKEIEIINYNRSIIRNTDRHDSKNIFVSINNKEYLFSISSYEGIVELHDIDNGSYIFRNTSEFLGKNIYSYIFSLYELKYSTQNEYLLIYIKKDNNSDGYTNYLIKKFSFSDFSFDSVRINSSEIHEIKFMNRIVSGFIINNTSFQIIVLFYVDKEDSNSYFYKINIYDFNLTKIFYQTIENIISYNPGYGLFSKCFHLKDNYVLFIYFNDKNSSSLRINIGKILGNYSYESTLIKGLNEYNFKYNTSSSDAVKVDEGRLIYLAFNDTDLTKLIILLIDLFNDYNNLKIREYIIDFNNAGFRLDISGAIFNNHLVLSTCLRHTGTNDTFSVFMMFGYINETDSIIDLSEFFMDNDLNSENNIVTKLTKDIEIYNNIFGYKVLTDKIKLIDIPNEILFFNKTDEIQVNNGDILAQDYILRQNNEIIKNGNYYYLDYQIIVQESDYDTFNSYANRIINYSNLENYQDQRDYFFPKQYFGKINTIEFKLCHDFCSSCKKFGYSNVTQECLSCKEEYQYGYPYEFSSNCVPENYFYDDKQNKLIQCNLENSKFYFNSTTDKKICFNNNMACPDEFPFLNVSNKECIKNCTIKEIINNRCLLLIKNKEKIYDIIKTQIIENYPSDAENLIIKTDDNFIFQLTTISNEQNLINEDANNDYNLSMIDLEDCIKSLKDEYHFDENTNLIILKYEKLSNAALEKNVQYEIFEPYNKTQLNKSICKKDSFYLYIPTTLSEETQNLYEDLKKYGYDLFNINDPFYQDICTKYKSKDGTDVLLSDRKNYYYNNQDIICQSNCSYSSFLIEKQIMKCQCNIVSEKIDVKNEHFKKEKIITSFYEVLKYSNYKVLTCYKLVLDISSITNNLGSIVSLFYFLLYFCCLVNFIFQGIRPLKIYSSSLIFESIFKKKIEKENNNNNKKFYRNSKNSIRKTKKLSLNFPPKKIKLINKKYDKIENKEKSKKIIHKTNINIIYNNNINNQLLTHNTKNLNNSRRNLFPKYNIKEKQKSDINLFNKKKRNKIRELDNFELNELDYYEAIELDKRQFSEIYWSTLMREHIILFTFFSCNDYNIKYIKFARFTFLLCSDMAMNVFFFSDDSMHKIYLNYGKYNFIQQIPQIVYSTLLSQLLEVFLCYLSLTDKSIYQIKKIKENGGNKLDIFLILKQARKKLIIFYIFTLILFSFFWYCISAFCSVYQNTQNIFIKDCVSSFSLGLMYPFILYLFPSVLRLISLRDNKKRSNCMYRLSDIIPFF